MRSISADEQALLDEARKAGLRSYSPYSAFPVGAAVLTEKGIYAGCNIENASYGLSICAERSALFAAISDGATQVQMLAVSCLKSSPDEPDSNRMPCGACRQVIAEFMRADCVVVVDGAGVCTVDELLPQPFQLSNPVFLERKTS